MTAKKKIEDFESAISRLEVITDKLESGDIKLEESMALYNEGVEIAKYCNNKLSDAEKKIKIIKEQNQGLIETSFEDDE